MAEPRPLFHRAAAELAGTYLLVFFGCGAVHAAVLAGELAGLGQVAAIWALAILLAISTFGGVSGAHINPAMTIASAVWAGFRWRDVPVYVTAQVAGAFLAAATLFVLFGGFLAEKEAALSVTRGQPGSETTAMCYGEYFPNPAVGGPSGQTPASTPARNARVSHAAAFFAEFLGTMILAAVVFSLTDANNPEAPRGGLVAAYIGLTVMALICVIAPLTQACFNPARDFGPRLFASFAGWGDIALPGPRGVGFLTVYILAPIAGAVVGGGIWALWLRPLFPKPTPSGDRAGTSPSA